MLYPLNNLELVHCCFSRRKYGTIKFRLQHSQIWFSFNNQTTKHSIAVKEQFEDTGIKEILQKLYNAEFNEVQPESKHAVFSKLEELSSEDKQFMMMLENGA